MRRLAAISMLLPALILCLTGSAGALKYGARRPWMAGVGIGLGTGKFDDVDETARKYRTGAVPQIRFGRMIGRHFMIGADYKGWIIEYDRYGEASITGAKIRRSLQQLAFGLAWFPGNPEGPWGGLYMRAGAGPGWSGTAIVEVVEGGKQEHGERIDDWGTAAFGEIGYEFWISGNTAIGLLAGYSYFDIRGDIVEKAWMSSLALTLNLCF